MLPLDVIKEHFPNASEEDLKKIQVFVFQLCCGIMQHFYGENWDKYIDDQDWKNEKD